MSLGIVLLPALLPAVALGTLDGLLKRLRLSRFAAAWCLCVLWLSTALVPLPLVDRVKISPSALAVCAMAAALLCGCRGVAQRLLSISAGLLGGGLMLLWWYVSQEEWLLFLDQHLLLSLVGMVPAALLPHDARGVTGGVFCAALCYLLCRLTLQQLLGQPLSALGDNICCSLVLPGSLAALGLSALVHRPAPLRRRAMLGGETA